MAELVQSFARGLAVLSSFSADAPQQTLSQVALATNLPRATARRLLHTLVDLGYADTDGDTFWLTARVLELGYSYLSSLQLPDLARPHMEKLSRELGESTSLSVLDGVDVVYVSRVPVKRIMSISITIGSRFPAYATSMGRVLLSTLSDVELAGYLTLAELVSITPETLTTEHDLRHELAKVRQEGVAIVDQELEAGLRSVAAPITDSSGKAVAAINVSTHVSAYSLSDIHADIIPALRTTAADISRLLTERTLS